MKTGWVSRKLLRKIYQGGVFLPKELIRVKNLLTVWSKKVNTVLILRRKKIEKELVTTKEDDKGFENSKFWICHNFYVEGDVKVTDHCYITGKYNGST